MGVKKILQIAAGALILIAAWFFLPRAADQVQAQFAGYFAEQTVTFSFSPSGSHPPTAYYALPNIGQAGHSVIMSGGYGIPECDVYLQASIDDTNWFSLASAGGLPVFASGYYPYLRIVVNPQGSATCSGGFSGEYVGYQFPSSPNTARTNVSLSVSTPLPVWNFAGAVFPTLQILTQINCYNPGASPAFLQIFDSQTPTLGSLISYQAAIPAGAAFNSSVSIFSSSELDAGASTAWSGATAVSTPLNCTFTVNPYGPFY